MVGLFTDQMESGWIDLFAGFFVLGTRMFPDDYLGIAVFTGCDKVTAIFCCKDCDLDNVRTADT